MSASYIGSFLMGQQLTALQVALDAEKAKTATLETWASDRVKYAYPNDGSEGNEKTISRGSYYVLSSPFGAGVGFSVKAECYSEALSEWLVVDGMQYNSANSFTYGVKVLPRNEAGLISVETGQSTLKPIRSWIADSASSVDGFKFRIRCVREG